MAEQVNGIGLDVDNGLFEVGATLPQAGSWSIGCDVTIEDVDASVQEVRVNDISLSGSLAIPEVSVNIDANNDKVMDLEIGIAASGLSTGITESQIVPYDKIVKITEFSPESINERKYASSALAAKRIYDLINKGGAGLNEDELKDFLKRYGYVTEEYVNDILKAATNFFYLSEDGQSIGTPYNIFSEKEISANGLSVGSGGSGGGEGGGLIRNVLSSSSLGSVTSNDNFTTFNAFAIDSIYKKVKSIEEGNVSLSNYYTKSESDAKFALASSLTTVEGKIKEILTWFTIDENGNLRTELNLYSTKEISAGGLSASGGSTGGGLISTVLGIEKFGTVTTNSNTATFNAYAIDSLHKRIKSIEESEVDLTGYATEAWVAGQGFITSAALSPYMKTADANDTFATKTALNNLSGNHDSLAARVSTAEGNISANATAITNLGKRVTANEGNIAEILKWFAVDSNGNLYTTYNFYSTKEISSNGLSIGTGGSGGGLISQVFGTTAFGTIASESNSATFNAYAIDSLYKRIVSLEGKATAVSFVSALTSGKQIGTLSIDGVSTVLYGVDAYSKADADSTFLKLSGGTVTGNLNVLHKTSVIPLLVENKAQNYTAIAFRGANSNTAYLVYSGTGDKWEVTNVNWNRTSVLLHANNYSQYALPLSGGVLSGNQGVLRINGTSQVWTDYSIGDINKASAGYSFGMAFLANDTSTARIGVNDSGTPLYKDAWNGTEYTLIHSGNIGNYKAGGLVGQYVLDINNASANKVFSSGFQPANRPSENYATGWTLYNDELKYTYQLAYNTSGILYSRYKNTSAWSDWKTIAFTDSNVASATKLATARTIWGQSFDGTKNVSGDLFLPNNKAIYAFASDNSNSFHVASLGSDDIMRYGYASTVSHIRGNSVHLLYGSSHTTGFVLNSSGNVTIGSSDLAGTSAKLYVNGKIVGATFVETEEYGIGNASYGLSSGLKGLALLALKGNIFMPFGNVGIGTYDPQYKLDVAGTARVSGAVTLDSTLAVKNILRVNDASMNAILNIANEGGTINYVHLFVSSANSSNATTRPLVLQNGYGNVGIGINNPQYKLHVNGTARVSGDVSMGSTLNVTGLLTASSGVKVASGQAITFLDASGKEHKLTYDSTAGAFKFDGSVYATEEVSALGLSSSVSSEYLGYNLLLSDVNGADMAVKHGTTISAQTAATLNFKRIIPTDIDRACIIYIIKAASSNLSVPVVATSGIRMVNSSGAAATATATVSGVAGIMLIWDNASACWRGSII